MKSWTGVVLENMEARGLNLQVVQVDLFETQLDPCGLDRTRWPVEQAGASNAARKGRVPLVLGSRLHVTHKLSPSISFSPRRPRIPMLCPTRRKHSCLNRLEPTARAALPHECVDMICLWGAIHTHRERDGIDLSCMRKKRSLKGHWRAPSHGPLRERRGPQM